VAVALLVVLVAGAFGTYSWALTHWFVAATGAGTHEDVAVYRGLDVSIVGFDLHKVDHDTGLAVGDLTPAARSRVRGGIPANNAADADRILTALRDQRLPLCTISANSTTPTPTSPAATSPAATVAGPSPTVPSAARSTAAPRPTGAPVTASPTTGGSSPTASESTEPRVPGVDCREVK
jgi:protein phosphatase